MRPAFANLGLEGFKFRLSIGLEGYRSRRHIEYCKEMVY